MSMLRQLNAAALVCTALGMFVAVLGGGLDSNALFVAGICIVVLGFALWGYLVWRLSGPLYRGQKKVK